MKRITFRLTPKQRRFLTSKKKKETLSHRVRARIDTLLMTDRGKQVNAIADILQVTRDTVWRTKKRCRKEGIAAALEERPRSGQPKKYSMNHETELVACACSSPPEGRKRWTLELLSEQMRSKVNGCKTMNRETIRLLLKKTTQSLG